VTGEWRKLHMEELHNLTLDYDSESKVREMGGAFTTWRDV
jgi:hypothetical protein